MAAQLLIAALAGCGASGTAFTSDAGADANAATNTDAASDANADANTGGEEYSLIGKVMCGYQGWFNAPGDGTPRGWVHWGNGGDLSPDQCTVDMWPDMSEMGPDEKYLASEFYDGADHYVFSSHNYDTVRRHFRWMQEYGIDGVYLQRFVTETTPGSAPFNHRNDVLDYCKAGANQYGRKYAVMYDLSGLDSGDDIQRVVNDWKFLVDEKLVGRDAADSGYMTHNGQPVVAVWGLGFARSYEGEDTYDLIDFLKNDPTYGGNTVMLGVDDDWRTNSDTWFQQTLQVADIVSPWMVGRYETTSGVDNWASSMGTPRSPPAGTMLPRGSRKVVSPSSPRSTAKPNSWTKRW